jgi:hypothetical protein
MRFLLSNYFIISCREQRSSRTFLVYLMHELNEEGGDSETVWTPDQSADVICPATLASIGKLDCVRWRMLLASKLWRSVDVPVASKAVVRASSDISRFCIAAPRCSAARQCCAMGTPSIIWADIGLRGHQPESKNLSLMEQGHDVLHI